MDLSHAQFHRAKVTDESVPAKATRAYRNKRATEAIRQHMETEHHTNVSVHSTSHALDEHDRQHRAARLYGDDLGHQH